MRSVMGAHDDYVHAWRCLGFALALLVPPLLGVAKDVIDILGVGSLGDQAGTP
jgi:hypothetical protein